MDIEIVERIYRAIAQRDLPTLTSLIHPDIVITQDARLPWGGRHVGHAGFAELSAKLLGAIDSAVTTLAIFEADGAVFQYGRTRGRTRDSGQEFDIPEVHRWVIRDGQAVEAHYAIDTEAMLEALGPTAARGRAEPRPRG